MAKRIMILCDTGPLIELIRGNQAMTEELENIGFQNLALSSITIAEVYYGMKKSETRLTKELINKFNKYHINQEISKKFLEIMLGYKNKKIKIPDALIAATAIVNNVQLFTMNTKDFNFIKEIKLYNPERKLH